MRDTANLVLLKVPVVNNHYKEHSFCPLEKQKRGMQILSLVVEVKEKHRKWKHTGHNNLTVALAGQ